MEQAIAQAKKELAGIDKRWTKPAREAASREINESLAERLKELTESGREELAGMRQAAEVRRYKAQRAGGPTSAEEWAEASARARFVEQDVARQQPGEILEAARLAEAAGDRVGAWLVIREGQRRLATLAEAAQEQGDLTEASALASAGRQLQAAEMAQAEEKYREELHEIGEDEVKLGRMLNATRQLESVNIHF